MKTEQPGEAWNKVRLVGQKPQFRLKDPWAIRIHLQNAHAVRDLALFNLAIDSKLRGCDLVSLRVRDVTHVNQVLLRAQVVQRRRSAPVQFELTEPTWFDASIATTRLDGFLPDDDQSMRDTA
ncbi:phage integrase [Caballeronia choica]|uniref:Phage integrase n=1 Tax=Caballeronia choica TaxID=326476 RepID=A0A158FV96_9BURK|nr:phage integrase [Caballeronia choica]